MGNVSLEYSVFMRGQHPLKARYESRVVPSVFEGHFVDYNEDDNYRKKPEEILDLGIFVHKTFL